MAPFYSAEVNARELDSHTNELANEHLVALFDKTSDEAMRVWRASDPSSVN